MLALAELCRELAVKNPTERAAGHALTLTCDIRWDRTKEPPQPITAPKVWSSMLTTERAAVYFSTDDPTPYGEEDAALGAEHDPVENGPRYHDTALEALRAVLDNLIDRTHAGVMRRVDR